MKKLAELAKPVNKISLNLKCLIKIPNKTATVKDI